MKRICLVIHSLSIGGMERVMSLLANSFAGNIHSEVHLLLIGIKREVSYPLDSSITIDRPKFAFNNSRRTLDTLRTMFFIRSEIKKINPYTILCFGEMWDNLVLLSSYGLRYPAYISDRSQPNKNLGKLHNFLRNKLYPTVAGVVAQTEKAKEIWLTNSWNQNVKVIIGNPVREIEPNQLIQKKYLRFYRKSSTPVDLSTDLQYYQIIRLTGQQSKHRYPESLRCVHLFDFVNSQDIVLLTNITDCNAEQIADYYKSRWQIELFFKWIKQNLCIKAFYGQSINAVKTQIWTAICTYLIMIISNKTN